MTKKPPDYIAEIYPIGHAWEGKISAHVTILCDKNCQPLPPIAQHKPAYNLSDYTGDNHVNSAHYKRQPQHVKDTIHALIEKATENAQQDLEYKQARFKPANAKELRFAWLIPFGLGGYSVYYDERPNSYSHLEGYEMDDETLNEARQLRIPIIDKRAALKELDTRGLAVAAALASPMPARKINEYDLPPYGSMSYAPLNVYAFYWEKLNAIVENIDTSSASMQDFRESTRVILYECNPELLRQLWNN